MLLLCLASVLDLNSYPTTNCQQIQLFYANRTYVTGNTYWRSWSIFSSNPWLPNIRILVALCNCDFINIIHVFSIKLHSMFSHYPRCRTKSHTYRQCYVRNAVKYGSFVADSYSPCLSCLLTATELLYVTSHLQTVCTTTRCVCSVYTKYLWRSEFRRIIVAPIFM